MKTYCVKLEPLTPFYSGTNARAGKSGALVHSDTLHAALLSVSALTNGELLKTPRELYLSSVFPFWRDILCFPKPFMPLPGIEGQSPEPESRKRWKSVRLVSEKVLCAWLAGDTRVATDSTIIGGNIAVFKSEIEGKAVPPEKLTANEIRPAIIVDRSCSGTGIYERRSLRVNADKGCGVFFYQVYIFHTIDRVWTEDLETVPIPFLSGLHLSLIQILTTGGMIWSSYPFFIRSTSFTYITRTKSRHDLRRSYPFFIRSTSFTRHEGYL